VLLHDGAIRSLEEARGAIAAGRIETRFHRVSRAHATVTALQSCLDFERGGEIAQTLDRLYGHILGRLILINQRNDPAICDELAGLLRQMRAGWAEIADEPHPGAPPPPAGSRGLPTALSA
jgi:flagellar protein FliS